MGKDDLFKRAKTDRQKRKRNTKDVRQSPWILICEGKETEPNYFRGLENYLNGLSGRPIKIIPYGVGRSTNSLVENAREILKWADQEYAKSELVPDRIVCVFDKDDASEGEFNSSIQKAEDRGYQVAWSNECFEVWIYAHFYYCETAMSRKVLFDKLTEIFRENGILRADQNYQEDGKVLPDLFGEIINHGGNLDKAISNCEKLYCSCKSCKPSAMKPCTTVFQLVKDMMKESGT